MIDENRTSPAALALRQRIEEGADEAGAVEIANAVVISALDHFNTYSERYNMTTSLLARTMMVRAMLDTASAWLAEITGDPRPLCAEALRSLTFDQPVWLATKEWREPDAEGEN